MMTFGDITTRARDIYAARFEPEGVRPLAAIYWRTAIITGCLLGILTLLFGLWNLFGIVDTLSSLSDTSPPPPAAFSSAQLHTLSAGFGARQTQFTSLTTNPPAPLPDPSK